MKKHSPRADAGFTLPEVLITLVLLGTITTVLAGVAITVLRTTPPTEVRAEDARSMLGLVTWLPQDVDSTPETGFNQDPARPSGCGTSPGTNILHLTWTEEIGGTTARFISNYRHVEQDGEGSLQRITCNGTGAPPYANGTTQNLTGDLPLLPAGWSPGNTPLDVDITLDPIDGDVDLVTFEITTMSGEVIRTDSAPKNPSETLPSTTLPSWYIPTPTTAVQVNNPPIVSNHAISANPAPSLTSITLNVTDPDGHTMMVTVDPATVPAGWIVNLASLTLTVSPPLSDVGLTHTIAYIADDQNGGVSVGYVDVTVIPVSATTTTTSSTTTTSTTTTTIPLPSCSVLGSSLSSSTVKNVQAANNGATNVGMLSQPILVSVATNGHCTGLEIQYESGGVNSPPFVNMTQTGPATWEVSLPSKNDGSSETWADGPHNIFVHSAEGGPWTSLTLTVT